jgi:hypothetical protein
MGNVQPALNTVSSQLKAIVPTVKAVSLPLVMLHAVKAHSTHIVSALAPFPPVAIGLSVLFVLIIAIDIENQKSLVNIEIQKLKEVYLELNRLVVLKTAFDHFFMDVAKREKDAGRLDNVTFVRISKLMQVPILHYFQTEMRAFQDLILSFLSNSQLRKLNNSDEPEIKKIVENELARRVQRKLTSQMYENAGYIFYMMNPNEIYIQLQEKFHTCSNFFTLINARHQMLEDFTSVMTPDIYKETMRRLFTESSLDIYLEATSSPEPTSIAVATSNRVGGSKRQKRRSSSKITRVALRQ